MKFGLAALAIGALVILSIATPAVPIVKLSLVGLTEQITGAKAPPTISPTELTIQRQGELPEIEPNGI